MRFTLTRSVANTKMATFGVLRHHTLAKAAKLWCHEHISENNFMWWAFLELSRAVPGARSSTAVASLWRPKLLPAILWTGQSEQVWQNPSRIKKAAKWRPFIYVVGLPRLELGACPFSEVESESDSIRRVFQRTILRGGPSQTWTGGLPILWGGERVG